MKRILAIATLAALSTGCAKLATQNASGEHSWTKAGDLRIALQQDLKNLNPLLNSNTSDAFVVRLMFEPLLTADDKGNPLPMLASVVPTAQNGGISKDGLTITYHLVKNAKWTDGIPVTSKDVKFSWQAIMNPNNNIVSTNGYDDVKSIVTPDDFTVVVHLSKKFSPFVNTFFAESDQPYPIAPEHILAKYPNINQIQFNEEPNVSDGPFRFAEWVKGDHVTLVRNDGFFLGTPKLARIDLRIIPDENTSVNSLKTHDVDWIYQASIDNYEALKDVPDTRIAWVGVNGYESIQINTARPFLTDVRVRQAVAYALDKQRLVDTLTYGQDQIAAEDIPHWLWAYDPGVQPITHDLGKAKGLLAQAGWSPGADGIMQKNGQPLTLVLVSNNSNVTRRKASVQIQAMLKQAGMDVQIKYFPGQILFAPAGEGGILQLGQFDLSLAGWYAGIDPDDSSQFLRKMIPPGGYNYTRYYSPEMEAAQKMALENYDQPTRKKAYTKIQQLLARDQPEIFNWYTRQMQPISVDFKGFDPNPVEEAWNAWQWSI
ncbi:MAG TPA: peptide ABC transporter substrate-binding protein [Verrucomicrobiae bacterium]|nr:peptide ABC transporter substrate-binding protein [Verrucomicrobiae bacterium]